MADKCPLFFALPVSHFRGVQQCPKLLSKNSRNSNFFNLQPVDGIQGTRHVGVKCGDGRPMHRENWFFGRILHEMITAQES